MENMISSTASWLLNDSIKEPTKYKRDKYVFRACLGCKRRKIKCNGKTPCERCGNMKLQCIYPPLDQPQRRRRRKKVEGKCEGKETKEEQVKQESNGKEESEIKDKKEGERYSNVILENGNESDDSLVNGSSSPDSLDILPEDLTTTIDNLLGVDESPIGFTESIGSVQSTHSIQTGPSEGSCTVDTNTNDSIDDGSINMNNIENSNYIHILENDTIYINNYIHQQAQSTQQNQAQQNSLGYEFEQRHLYSLNFNQARKLIDSYECEVNCMYPLFPMGTLDTMFTHIYEQYCLNGTLSAKEEEDLSDIKIVVAIGSSISNIKVGCGKRLYEDFMSRVERRLLSRPSDIKTVESLLLVHSYQFLSDLGTLAYRSLEFACIMALELGLHKTKQTERLFHNFQEREHGRIVFWCLYIMDRLQSIYTKRPYILHDSDIDQDLPQCFDSEHTNNSNGFELPNGKFSQNDDLFRSLHLNYMIRYSKLSGELLNALGNEQPGYIDNNMQHLIFLMERWRTSLPAEFNISTSEGEDDITRYSSDRAPTPIGSRKLKYIADLRPSLILLHVYQSCNVESYLHPAIKTSCECIRELGRLYFNTSFYSSCETQYNHVLVAALEVLYSCLRWAPQYAKSCMPEIKLALKIISLIMKSSNSDRRQGNIWQLLMSFSFKFGLYSPFGPGKICDSTNQDEPATTTTTREVLITSLISELGDMTSLMEEDLPTTNSIIEEVINDDMF